MPPLDSIATNTTAASTKGLLADSNPDLDDVEVEKGGDKIKSSEYKKLTKQIAQLTKTIETLKKEKEGAVEEKHNLKAINKTLEKEVKHLSSSLDSCKSELDHLKLQHSKDKRRPQHNQQQEHTAELEDRVRRLETALVGRDEQVAKLQEKVELQEKMLGQAKTGEEEASGGGVSSEMGNKPEPEVRSIKHLEELHEEKEISSRLRSELEELRAKYLALEGEVEQARNDAFVAEAKPQIKGTPVPRVRSQSVSQMAYATHNSSSSSSPPRRLRLSSPSSPTTTENSRESRCGIHGSPYLSPRHVVSHAVMAIPSSPPPPPPSRTRSPSSQADISVLQNCLRLALEEKKASEQKREQLEEELLYLQAVMETNRANAAAMERLAQVDRELEQTHERLKAVVAEKAELEGALESLQTELAAARSRSCRMEGEMVRVTAERDAELKAVCEQNARLRKEIDELKVAISSSKASTAVPECQAAPSMGNVEDLKVASNGGAEGRKSPPTGGSDGLKRGTVECQMDPPASPQSPQRSAINRTADKPQKVSNKFVHMRAVFEAAKGTGEEASPPPVRRHSASLAKAPMEDEVKEEERAATLPGVHKKEHNPEPKYVKAVPATTPQSTAPPPPTPSLAPSQNVPLARTAAPFQGAAPTKPAAPTQTPTSPQAITPPTQISSPQAQTVHSTSPTQIVASSHVTPSVQMTIPSVQMTTPSVQMTTSSQAHTALPVQRIPMTQTTSPFYSVQPPAPSVQPPAPSIQPPSPTVQSSLSAAPSVKKGPSSVVATTLPIPLSMQGTSPPSQTAPLTQSAPPQATITPNATPSNQNAPHSPGAPSTQSTRTAPPSQPSPSRTASQSTFSVPIPSPLAATAPELVATQDLKGVPLTRVLTPTTRLGEQPPLLKATSTSKEPPAAIPLTRIDSKDQLATTPPSRSNLSPVIPIKTSTAIINVQKKEQSSSSGEATKPGAQTFSTSAPTRTFSTAALASTDATPTPVTTPLYPPRGIVKAERFTVRASSPLYQQGTAELKQAPASVQAEGDVHPKATPTTTAVAMSTPAFSVSPTPSTSITTPTSTTTPTSISISTTSSVQLRGPHKKTQRPMTYCSQSSTSPASSSSNLSNLISRMQVRREEEEGEGPSRALTAAQPSSAFMRVASWSSNGMSAATPTSANKTFTTITENRLVIYNHSRFQTQN